MRPLILEIARLQWCEQAANTLEQCSALPAGSDITTLEVGEPPADLTAQAGADFAAFLRAVLNHPATDVRAFLEAAREDWAELALDLQQAFAGGGGRSHGIPELEPFEAELHATYGLEFWGDASPSQLGPFLEESRQALDEEDSALIGAIGAQWGADAEAAAALYLAANPHSLRGIGEALEAALGEGWHHGVESIDLDFDEGFSYLNTGDTYSATIARVDGRLRVTTWGDELERAEAAHTEESGEAACAYCGAWSDGSPGGVMEAPDECPSCGWLMDGSAQAGA